MRHICWGRDLHFSSFKWRPPFNNLAGESRWPISHVLQISSFEQPQLCWHLASRLGISICLTHVCANLRAPVFSSRAWRFMRVRSFYLPRKSIVSRNWPSGSIARYSLLEVDYGDLMWPSGPLRSSFETPSGESRVLNPLFLRNRWIKWSLPSLREHQQEEHLEAREMWLLLMWPIDSSFYLRVKLDCSQSNIGSRPLTGLDSKERSSAGAATKSSTNASFFGRVLGKPFFLWPSLVLASQISHPQRETAWAPDLRIPQFGAE